MAQWISCATGQMISGLWVTIAQVGLLKRLLSMGSVIMAHTLNTISAATQTPINTVITCSYSIATHALWHVARAMAKNKWCYSTNVELPKEASISTGYAQKRQSLLSDYIECFAI